MVQLGAVSTALAKNNSFDSAGLVPPWDGTECGIAQCCMIVLVVWLNIPF